MVIADGAGLSRAVSFLQLAQAISALSRKEEARRRVRKTIG